MSTVLAPQIETKLERLDQLRTKQAANAISGEESAELEQLQLELELLPAAATPKERMAGAALRQTVQKLANRIRDIE